MFDNRTLAMETPSGGATRLEHGRKANRFGRLSATLAAIAAMAAALFVAAGPASASAYGCTGFGPGVTWHGVGVANGTWCGSITGNGTYVNYVGGNFFLHIPGPGAPCNFAERSEFYDSSGHFWGSVQTPTSYRCSSASDLANVYLNRNVPRGYVLMKLLNNGATVATVQENIS